MKFIKWTIVLLLWILLYGIPLGFLFTIAHEWYESLAVFYVAVFVCIQMDKIECRFKKWFDSNLK